MTAFIAAVRAFFALVPLVEPVDSTGPDVAPVIRAPFGDPISRFVAAYATHAGAPYDFGGANDAGHRAAAIADVQAALSPGDARARHWLDTAIATIDGLVALAAAVPAPVRFSVVEALYARGFTSAAQVAAVPVRAVVSARHRAPPSGAGPGLVVVWWTVTSSLGVGVRARRGPARAVASM